MERNPTQTSSRQHERARELAVDDAGEDRGHRVQPVRWPGGRARSRSAPRPRRRCRPRARSRRACARERRVETTRDPRVRQDGKVREAAGHRGEQTGDDHERRAEYDGPARQPAEREQGRGDGGDRRQALADATARVGGRERPAPPQVQRFGRGEERERDEQHRPGRDAGSTSTASVRTTADASHAAASGGGSHTTVPAITARPCVTAMTAVAPCDVQRDRPPFDPVRPVRVAPHRRGCGATHPVRPVVVPAGGGTRGDDVPSGAVRSARSARRRTGRVSGSARPPATHGSRTRPHGSPAGRARPGSRGPSPARPCPTWSSIRSPSAVERARTRATVGATPRTTVWKLLAGGPLVLCAPAGDGAANPATRATPRIARARRARRVMRSVPRAPAPGAAPARATRERIVPKGTPQISAASTYEQPTRPGSARTPRDVSGSRPATRSWSACSSPGSAATPDPAVCSAWWRRRR